MAADFIYMPNPARIGPFLDKIRAAGTPPKVTFQVIQSLGFKSTNDRPLLQILKALGLSDGSGVPTSRWSAFRSKPKAAIAAGIREHYAKLFALYPDAYQKDNEALRNFFSSHTSVSEATLKFMIATFKALCSLADFGETIPVSPLPAPEAVGTVGTPAVVAHSKPLITSTPGWTVNINVQLTLPENADSKTFDEFFKAMKKNLLDEK